MYNLTITLLLNFIIAIYVSKTETQETFYYAPITKQEAVDSLIELQTNQVLPLIQLLNKTNMKLQPPERLESVFTDGGRIIHGTRFTSENQFEQLFFCPDGNSDDFCLIPKEYRGVEPLECQEEPKPVEREPESITCGPHDFGKAHAIVYETKDYGNLVQTVYAFCYDSKNEKTMFTNHLITFPELLDAEALRQEHNVEYIMETSFGLSPSHIQQLRDTPTDEQEESNSQNIENQHPHNNQEPKKDGYELQKLTPPEDLPFALLRKATYRYYNTAWQHKALTSLWNEINGHIRIHAKKLYLAEGPAFSINTGVFDFLPEPRKDGQESNVWVKVINAMSRDTTVEDPIRGVVILMNNFLDPIIDYQTEKLMANYCKNDPCEEALKKKFEKIGGRVRCCFINQEIKKLFRWIDTEVDSPSLNSDKFNIPLLRIPGINELKNPPEEVEFIETSF